jgi:hypothetical protein
VCETDTMKQCGKLTGSRLQIETIVVKDAILSRDDWGPDLTAWGSSEAGDFVGLRMVVAKPMAARNRMAFGPRPITEVCRSTAAS